MNDDPVLLELEETGRKMWEKGGGTMHGYFEYCERVADQALAEYALYGERWRGVGREPAKAENTEGKARAEAQGEGGAEGEWTPVDEGAMAVCEGEAPDYQTAEPSNGQTVGRSNGGQDFAHSGAEGDAE